MTHGPYTYPLQVNPDLSREQQQVFGVDAVRHPITGMVLEQGSGALPPDEQARQHLQVIHKTDPAKAAAMFAKLNPPPPAVGQPIIVTSNPRSPSRGH